MDKWISVKNRLPQARGQYLVAAIEAGHYRHITVVTFTDHFIMNGHRALESDLLDAAA